MTVAGHRGLGRWAAASDLLFTWQQVATAPASGSIRRRRMRDQGCIGGSRVSGLHPVATCSLEQTESILRGVREGSALSAVMNPTFGGCAGATPCQRLRILPSGGARGLCPVCGTQNPHLLAVATASARIADTIGNSSPATPRHFMPRPRGRGGGVDHGS